MNAPMAMPHLRPVAPHTENSHKEIWRFQMPSACWQLLWWLICHMDENHEVRGGWRNRAGRALKYDRQWMGECARKLLSWKLIETAPRARWCKVLVKNIVG